MQKNMLREPKLQKGGGESKNILYFKVKIISASFLRAQF